MNLEHNSPESFDFEGSMTGKVLKHSKIQIEALIRDINESTELTTPIKAELISALGTPASILPIEIDESKREVIDLRKTKDIAQVTPFNPKTDMEVVNGYEVKDLRPQAQPQYSNAA